MKRMKTILAVAGLIWVMSHGFPIFEGEQIRSALNEKFNDYHVIDRKDNVVTVRVKDCFHTVTVADGNITNETKMCDKGKRKKLTIAYCFESASFLSN